MLGKLVLSNPYVVLALAAAVVASYAAVGYKGYRMGEDHCVAENAKLVAVEVRTRDAAIAGAAEEIRKIEVKNVTIRQKAETITREREVYRDCKMEADLLGLVNDALAGQKRDDAGAVGVGSRDR
jgi:Holliday junction resolvase-like predicted endonuclease